MRGDERMRRRRTRKRGKSSKQRDRAVARARRRRRDGGLKVVRCQGKKPPSTPPRSFIGDGRVLRSGRPASINCRNLSITSTGGPHHDRSGSNTAGGSSLRRGPAATEAKPSRPPVAPPTTRARAAAAPKKARPRCKTAATTAKRLNARAPCQARRALERGESSARNKGDPRWDDSVRRSPGTCSV
jgi:hypothetical protein